MNATPVYIIGNNSAGPAKYKSKILINELNFGDEPTMATYDADYVGLAPMFHLNVNQNPHVVLPN